MKKITKQFIFCALSLSALVIVGCSEDNNTGDSSLIVAQGVNGTISLVSPLVASQIVSEVNKNTYSFKITLDKPQAVDVQVRFEATGSAILGDDYEVITNDPTGSNAFVLIPANTTSATAKINILDDVEAEVDENFTLKIGTISTSNAVVNSNSVSFTIKNNLSPNLNLTFDYNHAFSISGTAYTLCGLNYDMDYYVLNSSFNDTGFYDAAASGCPEKLLMDSRFADGTYYVYNTVYNDRGLVNVYHDPFKIPTTVTFSRDGGIAPAKFVQEDAQVPTSTDGPNPSGTGDYYVITIVKAAGVYTLKNSLDQVIATGKNGNKIREALVHAKLNNKKK